MDFLHFLKFFYENLKHIFLQLIPKSLVTDIIVCNYIRVYFQTELDRTQNIGFGLKFNRKSKIIEPSQLHIVIIV